MVNFIPKLLLWYIKLYRLYFIRNSYKYYKYIYKLIRGFPGYCLECN